MTRFKPEIPQALTNLLEGVPWHTEPGGSHIKLFVDDKLVCILPKWMRRRDDFAQNTRAAVLRAVRQYHREEVK